MLPSDRHRAGESGTAQSWRGAEKFFPRTQKSRHQAAFISPTAIIALLSLLLLASLVASVYTHRQTAIALERLGTRIDKFVQSGAGLRFSGYDVADASDSSTLAVNSAARDQKAGAGVDLFQNIDERLSELTETLESLNTQVAAQPDVRSYTPPPYDPPPNLPVPNRTLSENAAPPLDASMQASGIPEETRTEVNEALRQHAEHARAKIEHLNVAGELDLAAIERIKRETQNQSADELRSRLPPEVLDEMFPAGLYPPEL